MIFSEMLRRKREAAGLTRAELAHGSGVAVEVIDQLEMGTHERASFDLCYKLSRALSAHTSQPFILQDLWCAARGQFSMQK
ncbi:MAG TPA: helix-turn-helix transcriptional regulator [Blastocatellia bacterium]|nr:helix-turn-helix transcriptional regulator [Blastocatellia bacterium]